MGVSLFLYLFLLHISPSRVALCPKKWGIRQAGFLWKLAISGEMSMSCLKFHKNSDLTLHECEVSQFVLVHYWV